MNLVPFNYQGINCTEANWGLGGDPVRRLRFTRKGWGEMFGAKQPQKYIDKLAERHPDLPEGIPVTVTGMTGQKYQTFTLDIYEGFQYATYSDLPRAVAFVRKFPEFLDAVRNGQIQPPPADITAIAQIPPCTRGIGELYKEVAEKRGKSIMAVRREVGRIRNGEPIKKPRTKGYCQKKNAEKKEKAMQLFAEGKSVKEVIEITDAAQASVYRWRYITFH